MKRIMISLVGLTLLAGCTTMRSGEYPGTFDIGASAHLKPDLSITERITGSASEILLFGFIPISSPGKYADGVTFGATKTSMLTDRYNCVKAGAAYDAITMSGADLIVAPQYHIEATNYILFTKIYATVTGFKGKIWGFKYEPDAKPAMTP